MIGYAREGAVWARGLHALLLRKRELCNGEPLLDGIHIQNVREVHLMAVSVFTTTLSHPIPLSEGWYKGPC